MSEAKIAVPKHEASSRKGKLVRFGIALIIFFAPAMLFPRWWCGREAPPLYQGKFSAYEPLAVEVKSWLEKGVSQGDFKTGSWQFNGEWAFGAYQMAGLGFCQLIEQFPEKKEELAPLVDKCIENILRPEIRAFDANSWQEDPIDSLDGSNPHVAYLGYFNLLLGMSRKVAPNQKFFHIHDRITNKLIRLLEASPILLLETYPKEIYPVDNTSAIGSIKLYDEVCGTDHSYFLKKLEDTFRKSYIDPTSGLLFQAVEPGSGKPIDKPRASGTALGAYFLSFADKRFSRELYDSLKKSCRASHFGFGALREYPSNVAPGSGDIDSGPLVFGLSMSGTGFVMASSRLHRDREFFVELYRMAYLSGFPVDRDGGRYFSLGGPLGTAIMLAMTTAGGRF